MTTIVCDRLQMSADSLLTGTGSIAHTRKIWRTKYGILGVAGTFANCNEFAQWMLFEDGDCPAMDSVSALLLRPDGIYLFDGHHKPYKITDKFCAIGSGEQAALTAMHCGKTTAEAVKLARLVDPSTGGRISTLKLSR